MKSQNLLLLISIEINTGAFKPVPNQSENFKWGILI